MTVRHATDPHWADLGLVRTRNIKIFSENSSLIGPRTVQAIFVLITPLSPVSLQSLECKCSEWSCQQTAKLISLSQNIAHNYIQKLDVFSWQYRGGELQCSVGILIVYSLEISALSCIQWREIFQSRLNRFEVREVSCGQWMLGETYWELSSSYNGAVE